MNIVIMILLQPVFLWGIRREYKKNNRIKDTCIYHFEIQIQHNMLIFKACLMLIEKHFLLQTDAFIILNLKTNLATGEFAKKIQRRLL